MELGYGFYWPPRERQFFVTDQGDHNAAPLVQQELGDDSVVMRRQTDAGRLDDARVLNLPLEEQAVAMAAEELADDDVLEPKVSKTRTKRDLKKDVVSISHLMTHEPKNPWCPTCCASEAVSAEF